jgi:hypothetical protein
MTLKQIEEIKTKRLSGQYTLQELGNEYGVTRERIRQVVGVPKLRKRIKKDCPNCGKTFIVGMAKRNLCFANCKAPHKTRPCIDCKIMFTPSMRQRQLIRCDECQVLYHRERVRIGIRKYQLKLKNLGLKRLNN